MSPATIVLVSAGFLMGFAILVIDFFRSRRYRAEGRKALEDDAEGRRESRQPEATDTLGAYVLTDERARFACGHDYATRFGHDFYGQRREVREEYAATREKCGDCMLAEIKPLIIRCCACGFAIWPGEPVAAYSDDGRFKKAWCTTLEDGKTVLGCMSWDCCPSGGFFAGHWSSRGFRPAFGPHLSLAAQVIATGKPVAVSVSDGEVEVTVLDEDDRAAVTVLENEGGNAKPSDGEEGK